MVLTSPCSLAASFLFWDVSVAKETPHQPDRMWLGFWPTVKEREVVDPREGEKGRDLACLLG